MHHTTPSVKIAILLVSLIVSPVRVTTTEIPPNWKFIVTCSNFVSEAYAGLKEGGITQQLPKSTKFTSNVYGLKIFFS